MSVIQLFELKKKIVKRSTLFWRYHKFLLSLIYLFQEDTMSRHFKIRFLFQWIMLMVLLVPDLIQFVPFVVINFWSVNANFNFKKGMSVWEEKCPMSIMGEALGIILLQMAPLQVRQQPVKLQSELHCRWAGHLEQSLLISVINDLVQSQGQFPGN